jgi:hypothetical protein
MSTDQDGAKSTQEEPGGRRCSGCEREVDVCAFCERGECTHTICFRCLQNELGQTKAHPHAHGG